MAACTTAYCAALGAALVLHRRRKATNRSHTPAHYTRKGLLNPHKANELTPWRQVLESGTDYDYVITTNFTKELFLNHLLPLFTQARRNCNHTSPYRRTHSRQGRKPLLKSVDLLGLALNYMKTSGKAYQLCPFFGIVPTSLSVWLDYSLHVLLRATKGTEAALFEIRWPSFQEQKRSAALLENNRKFGPLLKGVFAVTDGGRFRIQNYGDPEMQNAYYEGYTQQEEVTNLFVFNFFGEIIHAAINFPGSWHDTKLAGLSGLYHPKLSDDMTPPGMAILGDSAFVSNTRCTNGKIVRARKTNETAGVPDSEELAAIDLVLQRILPSERQSAEWGIRAIKAPFGRLGAKLCTDEQKRSVLIELAVRLLNYRTRTMGRNQIRSTYQTPLDN